MFALARRAVGRAASSGKALGAARVVTSSAAPEAAAAAAAAPAAKPANVQEFQIYRWDPDTGGKPRYQTYKVRATPRAIQRARGSRPAGVARIESTAASRKHPNAPVATIPSSPRPRLPPPHPSPIQQRDRPLVLHSASGRRIVSIFLAPPAL